MTEPWKPKGPPGRKLPWRDFLTAEEREILARADAAREEWQRLNVERASITNRAIQRAKYAAVKHTLEERMRKLDAEITELGGEV